jgi:hypothetical protein
MNITMSADEKKFVAFWGFIFTSALGFWIIIVRWVVSILA